MIAIDAPLSSVLAKLAAVVGPFKDLLPNQTDFDPSDGELILVGEREGRTYLMEPRGFLTSAWGLLVELSADLKALVACFNYDPSESHCELFVARNGQVQRIFWSNPVRASAPYSMGSSLPSESNHPLSGSGGWGLIEAFRCLGFDQPDRDGAIRQGDWNRYMTWPGVPSSMFKNEYSELVNAHARSHMKPDYVWPEPQIRLRATSWSGWLLLSWIQTLDWAKRLFRPGKDSS